nr:HEPN family nuclease [uncultured Bacteroides sp.]
MYNPEKDFIERTKILLEQYEKTEINSSEKYEVSLLLNCCVGLLLIPKEESYDKINERLNLNDDWGITESDITIDNSNSKSVKSTLRHLRNSVAHGKFEFLPPKKGNQIERIEFKDNSVTINIHVDQLKKFLYKLITQLT